ncbi:hypothetical protein [Cohnella lupini]|uniref:PH (Pleckstrin Homology) domain-containing protein n=1 Tax=Cohnella lupini TaxID=1294267 RepID=A0A3D9IGN1_9BACL|nr:hypothetical protein [Cohnella lupini]RED60306.1 hypothetical protein DFP95_10695 [Cohnella lupini]
MSRSWERMVEKNSKQINKRRRKEGKKGISPNAPQIDRFRGRNYIVPSLLLMLIILYVTLAQPWSDSFMQDQTLFWVTIGCYVVLAVFYYFRRPYLAVTRDTLETRKFTGYKTLRPTEIRKISIQPGYVIIETIKGASWVFSRLMHRYPLERMSERLKTYSELHHIDWEVKTK